MSTVDAQVRDKKPIDHELVRYELNLPVAWPSDWHICMMTNIMSRIHPTKYQLSSILFINSLPAQPK